MDNLQNLYDYYIKTKPSAGKIRTATTLLIRICKALNMDAPEDVTPDFYKQIPQALDDYYGSSTHKAIQDKSILAEMIGRFGPRNGWENVIGILLEDVDANLRQFALQSLSYYGLMNPSVVMPFIEKTKHSEDSELQNISVTLLCKFLGSEHSEDILKHLQKWPKSENYSFFKKVHECLIDSQYPSTSPYVLNWLSSQIE